MGFSRQENWSGLSFPPPGDLPDRGIEPTSLVSPALAGEFFTTVPPGVVNTRKQHRSLWLRTWREFWKVRMGWGVAGLPGHWTVIGQRTLRPLPGCPSSVMTLPA